MQNKKEVNNVDIEYLGDLVKDSFAYEPLVNSFCIFETFDHILMIIYSSRNNSIISYNIIENKKIKEIENAHNKPITIFSHYFDNSVNKRDLIISVSSFHLLIIILNYGIFKIGIVYSIKLLMIIHGYGQHAF